MIINFDAYQLHITLHSYFVGGARGVVDAVDQAVSDLPDTLRSAGLPGESALAAGRPGDRPRAAAARLLPPPAVVAAEALTSPANGAEGAPPPLPAMMRGALVRVAAAAAAAAVQAGASPQSSGEAPPRSGRCCRCSARGLGLGEWPAVYLDLEMGKDSEMVVFKKSSISSEI